LVCAVCTVGFDLKGAGGFGAANCSRSGRLGSFKVLLKLGAGAWTGESSREDLLMYMLKLLVVPASFLFGAVLMVIFSFML
jgi:hypothetical protein